MCCLPVSKMDEILLFDPYYQTVPFTKPDEKESASCDRPPIFMEPIRAIFLF